MVILCQMPEFKLSCFGCCGHSYANKKKVLQDIRKNTIEFENKESLSQFMQRNAHLTKAGVCHNLIYKDGTFFCPGHPVLHGGRDYRNLDPLCMKDYLCKTFGLFQQWDKEKQQRFLDFLKEKNLDSYEYSIKMDNDSLLKEFEGKIRAESSR